MNKKYGGLDRPIVPIKKQLTTLEEIKKTMIQACKIMDKFGLVMGFGHISSRIPGTNNILVTPRYALCLAEEKDLAIVDEEGKLVEGTTKPFAEIHMHLGIYRKRSDVGAICRFHTEITSVFGVLNRNIKPVHALGYLIGDEIKVLSSPDLGHKDEFAEKVGNLISGSYGIIFRGNGAATFGTNIIDACIRALFLEETANILYKASILGKPIYLSNEERNRRNEDYWGIPDYDVYYRAWQYYVSKI